MFFKCKNCGANTIWSPQDLGLKCPHCDGYNSEELVQNVEEYTCMSCGAPMTPKPFQSAIPCEHCGAYTIFEERISGKYEPHLIIPFRVSKERAKEILKEQFQKNLFLPSTFLKEAYLDKMEGDYIPFFLFDIHCHYRFSAKGKKIRRWTAGNTEYVETSVYQIYRTMESDFFRVPTDASLEMPDAEMDLLEPFDYSKMQQFMPRYMSGFYGELYSIDGEALEPRAKGKVRSDAQALMSASISGYNSITRECDDCQCDTLEKNYALLPVWNYTYKYRGKAYKFRINGETGKMIGKAPISALKLCACSATFFAIISAMGIMLKMILEVL